MAHFHLGDFNNDEDKVFTFATWVVIVYSSGGSYSQKWLYDSRQILRPPRSERGERRLITRSQIEGSVARNEGARDTRSLSAPEKNICVSEMRGTSLFFKASFHFH